MVWIYISIVISASCIVWVISRWAMMGDGESKVMGFWVSATGSIIMGLIHLFLGESVLVANIIFIGFISGICASIGFLYIIMYCLKIGPTGLTSTINNSAMVFGVIFSFTVLDPHFPGLLIGLGIIGTIVGLFLIGLSGSNSEGTRSISPKWIKLVMIGGALSGVSYINQTYIGKCFSGIKPLLIFLFWLNLFSATILFLLTKYLRIGFRRRKEMIGGFSIGILTNSTLFFTILAMNYMGAEIVLPVTIAAPMVLMLLIGHFFYKEYLKLKPLLGAALIIISIILLSIGN